MTHAVNWQSSDESIATVNNGVVVGVSPGGATITATFQSYGSLSTAVVTDAVAEYLEIRPVVSTAFGLGQTLRLSADIHYSDGTLLDGADALTWSSDDESVATVAAGEVTGVGYGQVLIVTTYQDISASAWVTVAYPHVDSDTALLLSREVR